MRMTILAVFACLLALPAHADRLRPGTEAPPPLMQNPPAAVCLDVAKTGDIIVDQAAAASPGSIDATLFDIGNTDIRQWLLRKCYPDCEDMDAIEGLGTLMKLAESCGGKK